MKNIIPAKFRQIIASKFPNFTFNNIRNFISNTLLGTVPTKLQTIIPAKLREKIPQKFHKWVVPALALVLILILVCSSCDSAPAAEAVTGTVKTDQLDVHKKHSASSSVLGQLPEGLEIVILEEVTVDGAEWGRIEKTQLPDGTKVKGGWIDLQHIRFPGDPIPEVTEPAAQPQEEPPVLYAPDPELGTTVMGTVTTGKLNIRQGAGSKYETAGSYLKGDRIELLEIVTVDDTEWGRTGKGWVGMGYVHLDGTPPTPHENGEMPNSDMTNDGNYEILGYGVVDLGELNVRLGPGTEYNKVCSVLEGTRYAYYQIQGDWVRIEDGWVSTSYFYLEGTTADDAASAVVIEDNLNIRTGPATSFKSNGTLRKGAAVKILAQVDGWGYTEKGWISMSHVEFTYSTGSGTVTSGLNIRKEPNADSESVGTYSTGDSVTIIEVQGFWGKTDQGWINLQYVKYN